MLTEEEREQAIERARDCGWDYVQTPSGYMYVAQEKAVAFVAKDNVTIGFAKGGHLLLSHGFDENNLFIALARAGRCADRLAGAYQDIEEFLSGL